MKPVKSSVIRNMKPGEIASKLTDAREELMKLRFQQVTGQLTDSSRMKVLKRDIARMLTVLREQTKAEEVVEGIR
jgi:large subunit ribosomal protein L29